MTSDEKGQAACTLDLPLGSYYVKRTESTRWIRIFG